MRSKLININLIYIYFHQRKLIVYNNFDYIKYLYLLYSNLSILFLTIFIWRASSFMLYSTQFKAFFRTYYLNKDEKEITGVFSGLDIENRLISGDLTVNFEPVSDNS